MNNRIIARPNRRQRLRWTDRPYLPETPPQAAPDVYPSIVRQLSAHGITDVSHDAQFNHLVEKLELAVFRCVAVAMDSEDPEDHDDAAVQAAIEKRRLAKYINGLLAA